MLLALCFCFALLGSYRRAFVLLLLGSYRRVFVVLFHVELEADLGEEGVGAVLDRAGQPRGRVTRSLRRRR